MSRFSVSRNVLWGMGGLAAILSAGYLIQNPVNWAILSASEELPGGMAIVELFNSPERADCLIANELIAKIAGDSRVRDRPIHCLTFIPEETDITSTIDSQIKDRESVYLRNNSEKSLNTPQIIVNGSEHFQAADSAQTIQGVESAVNQVAPVLIELRLTPKDNEVEVICQIRNAPVGADLVVAWVESTSTMVPTHGKNKGRQLTSVNIVRDFRRNELTATMTEVVTLQRPNMHDGQVVAFVQEAGQHRILGASAAIPYDE